jgi:branched-chain amino acid transport system ATP-binding protein
MTVGQGEIVALIGANGAGKSTTMRAISGLRPIAQGSIHFDGQDISRLRADLRVVRGVSQSPEGRGIFPGMTVRENLEMGAYTRRNRSEIDEDLDRAFTLFPRLKEREKQAGGTLSGGEQQMLAVGRALMSRPKLLLLDEPSMGLAPILIQQIFDIIVEINQQGTTVLLVEQNAQRALSRAHRAYVLETGRIVKAGTGAELLNDPSVKDAYLGVA